MVNVRGFESILFIVASDETVLVMKSNDIIIPELSRKPLISGINPFHKLWKEKLSDVIR